MKKGDLSLLSAGLKNRSNPFTGIDNKYLELNELVKILETEKKIQKFLNSLKPGDILVYKDSLNTIESPWIYAEFIEVIDIERRLISMKTNEEPEITTSAYYYGDILYTLKEFEQFVM